jgi:hypothetical protein
MGDFVISSTNPLSIPFYYVFYVLVCILSVHSEDC